MKTNRTWICGVTLATLLLVYRPLVAAGVVFSEQPIERGSYSDEARDRQEQEARERQEQEAEEWQEQEAEERQTREQEREDQQLDLELEPSGRGCIACMGRRPPSNQMQPIIRQEARERQGQEERERQAQEAGERQMREE